MPCVYLPGPAPAVTVANSNWNSLKFDRYFELMGILDLTMPLRSFCFLSLCITIFILFSEINISGIIVYLQSFPGPKYKNSGTINISTVGRVESKINRT